MGQTNIIKFREEIAVKTGEPAAALQISERTLDFSSA